jgi:Spy/CpxP family protein refolding chaperone
MTTLHTIALTAALPAALALFGAEARALVATDADADAAAFAPADADADADARGGGRLNKLCDALACTAAQKTQIRDIFRDTVSNQRGAREQTRALREQVAAEFAKAKPDRSKLNNLWQQLDAQHAARRAAHREAMMKVHAVLTPAQRAKLGRRLEHGAGGKGHGPGGKGHGPGGKSGKGG